MQLVALGLSHRTAPVGIRERFAVSATDLLVMVERVQAIASTGVLLVSTCNRVEFFGATAAPAEALSAMAEVLAAHGDAEAAVLAPHLYRFQGAEAVEHLFRVSASLDSMVVGEAQILGQLKGAFETCRTAGTTGGALNRAVERSFAVAKRVRTETGIGRAAVSISSVAVGLAQSIFGDLAGRTALLVGAGQMGELAARHLVQAGVEELLVANRSPERAKRVADALGGHARGLDELPQLLVAADVVIVCTGAKGYVIEPKLMKRVLKARKYRPVFLIDIAVPRNIDPQVDRLDNVYVYDVDDLSEIAAQNLAARQLEAQAAEVLVVEEAKRFIKELAGLAVKPTIIALRQKVARIKAVELERSKRRLAGLDRSQAKTVEVLVDSILNKLLHDVQTGLRQAAGEGCCDDLVAATRRLFALDEPPESP